jgi:hypothetical protein
MIVKRYYKRSQLNRIPTAKAKPTITPFYFIMERPSGSFVRFIFPNLSFRLKPVLIRVAFAPPLLLM